MINSEEISKFKLIQWLSRLTLREIFLLQHYFLADASDGLFDRDASNEWSFFSCSDGQNEDRRSRVRDTSMR